MADRTAKWVIPGGPFYLSRVETTRLVRRTRRSVADADVLTDFSTPHPILGPMSQSEWRGTALLHTDHHLRQFGL